MLADRRADGVSVTARSRTAAIQGAPLGRAARGGSRSCQGLGRLVLTRAAATACVLAVLHRPVPAAARSHEPPCDDTCWRAAVAAYVADPVGQRRTLIALQRRSEGDLPPEIALLLADAHLRSGQNRAAAALFDGVWQRESPEPMRSWAALGGAWIAARSGEIDRAMALLGDAEASGHSDPAVVLLAGYLGLARRDPGAARRLRELMRDPQASREVRNAARMMVALDAYWSGDPAQAREDFRVVAEDDASALQDAAAYGVARMLLAQQQIAAAVSALERLAEGSSVDAPAGSVPRGMLDLDRSALLRRATSAYRRSPLEAPSAQVVRLLDWDGVALARAMLARLRGAPPEEHDGAPLEAREAPPQAFAVVATDSIDAPTHAIEAHAERSGTSADGTAFGGAVRRESGRDRITLYGLAVLAAAVGAWGFLRRAGSLPVKHKTRSAP
jgi:hypothetical protein